MLVGAPDRDALFSAGGATETTQITLNCRNLSITYWREDRWGVDATRDRQDISSAATQSAILRRMTTRRTVPVEIDAGTVALAELAATRQGMSVPEWIAKAARREFASLSPGPDFVELTAADMLAEDAEQAADEAMIAAEAKRFRAAG